MYLLWPALLSGTVLTNFSIGDQTGLPPVLSMDAGRTRRPWEHKTKDTWAFREKIHLLYSRMLHCHHAPAMVFTLDPCSRHLETTCQWKRVRGREQCEWKEKMDARDAGWELPQACSFSFRASQERKNLTQKHFKCVPCGTGYHLVKGWDANQTINTSSSPELGISPLADLKWKCQTVRFPDALGHSPHK